MEQRIFNFSVTGKGSFPLDMLRYDSCWPTGKDCADELTQKDTKRKIHLKSIYTPTPARWKRLGWPIKDLQ